MTSRPWYKKKRYMIPATCLGFVLGLVLVNPDPDPKAPDPELVRPISTVTAAVSGPEDLPLPLATTTS